MYTLQFEDPVHIADRSWLYCLLGLDVKGQDNFNNFMGGHMNNYIKHNEYTKQTKSR